jgi:hypothetical protein
MPTVSVALATFNGERYLAAQLESLAKQTLRPLELIAVDDGSSDHTVEIIRSFAASAPFEVRLTQNSTRLGYRENFMKAAAFCSGDLIAFCDQDDVWHPDKLVRTQQAFEDPELLLAYHNSELIDEGDAVLGAAFGKRGMTFSPLGTRPWLVVPGHAQVFRRSLLKLTPLHSESLDPYAIDQPMPHDQWSVFWASVLGKIRYLPDSLTQYRQHAANTSGWPLADLPTYVRENISSAARYAIGECMAAKNRLELLHRASPLLDTDAASRLNAATRYYEALIVRSELRQTLYTEKRLSARATALLGLIRRHVYGRSPAIFGFPTLLLDAAIGVPSSSIGR